jgi:tetratricopeptide (TPR) repeat protein
MSETVNFFKKAIEIDPRYALPHAQLAFAYTWTGVFIEPAEPKWADLARAEIKQANELNPNLAETHIAHALLLWSPYEGYQDANAVRELRLAKQLDPNISSPDLAALYGHLGLDDLAIQETKRALEINPTSQSLKSMPFILAYLRADPDGWFSEHHKLDDALLADATNLGWYYMRKGRLDEAQSLIDERLRKNPPAPEYLLMLQAQLHALKGDFANAQAGAVAILAKVPISEDRHHYTYDTACIYALAGNSSEAVRWLKETANTGFPDYPLFERDPYLNRVRQAPEFIEFMADQKVKWEKLRMEFGR